MAEMKSLTLNDKTYDGFVDPVARAMGMINSASGESVTVSDSNGTQLFGLNIYGKTIQDGTPSPDSPVDLVSVGKNGDMNVLVRGKNIADIYGFSAGGTLNPPSERNISNNFGTTLSTTAASDTLVVTQTAYPDPTYTANYTNGYFNIGFHNEFKDGEQITISFDVTITNNLSDNNTIVFAPNGVSGHDASITNGRVEKTITWQNSGNKRYLEIRVSGKSMIISNIQIERGNMATEYATPIKQALTISTPNGLPGIPVTSGGNYTDANGQQWICDEIDFARGVYVQRVRVKAFDGTEGWVYESNNKYFMLNHSALGSVTTGLPLSSHFYRGTTSASGVFFFGSAGVAFYHTATSVGEWKQFLSEQFTNGTPVRLLYVLATQTETALPAEELAAYAALHAYKDHTTVSNDAGAWMDLEYVMDAKKYIDSLVAAPIPRLATITLSSASWTGADSLYSQVVTIPGITKYSKVDLLPSVEQLAIFHNKDVAFVTENENGVVTVYAIGDKPLLDYTMQVQITEVDV